MPSTSTWIILILCSAYASSLPTTELPTTRRSNQPQIGEAIKQLANQLINVNASSQITLDTRTPPRIRQHIRKPVKVENDHENSHPGVAEPVQNADLILEESTKKLNFYKIENKPTTVQGISTWVLLNSQSVPPSVTTAKTTPKPTIKQKFEEEKNLTRTEIFNKITKPLFKKRPISTTTKKPIETTTTTVEQKFTKVKASVLNNAINNKNKNLSTTAQPKKESKVTEATTVSTTPINNSTYLPVESKDGEVDLLTTTVSNKKRRPTAPKKKKNKNRRRRPNLEKTANNTKLAVKEKPIGTQIYNYLSREIMPTVGVGLVGLMVTAGLASYFLYPFGPVRRSYEVDRKDKEGTYYYTDEYSPGGISEEEAIGKVIAGMPVKNGNSAYQNLRGGYQNRKTDYGGLRRGQSEASVEAIYLTPSQKYNDKTHFSRRKEPDFFTNFGQKPFHQEIKYVTDKTQLYGIPEATPVVVPEHGPRNLPEATTPGTTKITHLEGQTRRRRSSDIDNEIYEEEDRPISTKTTPSVKSTTVKNTTVLKKPPTLMDTLKMLLETQIKVGLQFLQKTTQAVASYFTEVNKRFNSKMSKEESRIFMH